MAIEFWYRASGVWRKAKEVHYKQGGVWRKAKEIWYRSGGTWKKVFEGVLVIPLPGGSVYTESYGSSGGSAGFTFYSSGLVEGFGNDSFNHRWFDGTPDPSQYEIMATLQSGTTPSSGPALDTWHLLSTNRTWTASVATTGTKSFTLLIQIRHISGTPTTSGSYSAAVNASSGLPP